MHFFWKKCRQAKVLCNICKIFICLVVSIRFGCNKQEWRLLYRGSKDGFSSDVFHRKCDGVSPTFTIVKVRHLAFSVPAVVFPWTFKQVKSISSVRALYHSNNVPAIVYCQGQGENGCICGGFSDVPWTSNNPPRGRFIPSHRYIVYYYWYTTTNYWNT